MKNSIGRNIPPEYQGIKFKPYSGAFEFKPVGKKYSPDLKCTFPGENKIRKNVREALRASGIRDGISVSFHHHLRNGDYVINMVMDEIASMGIKGIKFVPTALFGVHKKIIEHIKTGVISKISGSLNGPVGRFVSDGNLDHPVMLRSHGGRARAIESGDLTIDIAIIAAPTCDEYGTVSSSVGESACGPLGYAVTDSQYAKQVIVITDNLVSFPGRKELISYNHVDHIVEVEKIGNPGGIVSGTTVVTRDTLRLKIGHFASKVIEHSGLLKEGFSFQTGAGGASLATADFVRNIMIEKKIRGSFASGGITGLLVDMYKSGLFEKLLDVQSFDLDAVRSYNENEGHIGISASEYANPHTAGCIVNRLDCVLLGATEVDLDFNVNVNTEVDGALLHGIGGHQDTAAGAFMTVIVAPRFRGNIPLVVDSVTTVTTPGETVDVLVTENGIAVNPRREDLMERFKKCSGLPFKSIEQIRGESVRLVGKGEPIEYEDDLIGVIEYRDGTIIDVVRKVANNNILF